uniref:Uncharacterized protein n=1 Tax=Panagrellus redivivus TaxID=6233 RepID=A0A7E4V2W5_PANRE
MNQNTISKLENCLFTSSKPDAASHECVLVVAKRRAVSHQNGSHASLKLGEKLKLYHVLDLSITFEVVVTFVSPRKHFVFFESLDRTFPFYPKGFKQISEGKEYFELGLNQNRKPVWNKGQIDQICRGYSVGITREDDSNGLGLFDKYGVYYGLSVERVTDEDGDKLSRVISAMSMNCVAYVDSDSDNAEKEER